MNWSERDKKVNWHPFSAYSEKEILAIIKAEGIYLFDENGNKYMDAISSWWVNLHGHNHPYLLAAIGQHLKSMDHIIFAGMTHPKAVELAEKLLQFVPGNYSRVFYSDDGSTANEVALKMAMQYFYNIGKSRKKIIGFENAYHGDTFGAMSAGGKSIFNLPFQSHLLEEVIHIPVPVKPYSEQEWSMVEKCFSEEVAAFIFEPLLQGAGGMIMYDAETLNKLVSLAKSKGIITIADEVLTGFGRTGSWFAMDQISEMADLVCLSKGLTGGVLPLGVTLVNEKVLSGFKTSEEIKFYHGHSYTANSIACAVACANLDLLNDDCMKRIKNIEKSNRDFIKNLNHPSIRDPRCIGTVLAINYGDGKSEYENSLRNEMYSFFIKKGLLMRPLGNVSYIIPPYCITNDELQMIYQSMLEFADIIR
jgi:adenosylmethionine-8-amino-7-oxononanoate aminotransferase